MSEHVTGRSTQTKERILSMTGWLDISTVPNDVYEILAVNEFGTIKVCYRKLFGHVSGRWEYFRNDEMVPGHTWSMVPTHWMPLPKPPAKFRVSGRGYAGGNAEMSEHVIWETRDFRRVRILCTDKPGPFPIVGYFIGAKEPESLDWMHDGRLLDHREDYSDLIIPEGTVVGQSK